MQQALIVDDSRTARVTLAKMLEKHGIHADGVDSGEQALEFLRTHHPDVIFMDHMMPGMDGFAAVKAIKSNPARAAIPVVMYTTKQGEIYRGQARALGAEDLLTKPATHQELVSVLERVEHVYSNPGGEVTPAGSASGSRPARNIGNDTMELDAHAVAMAVEMAAVRDRAREREAQDRAAMSTDTTMAEEQSAPPFLGTARQWLLALIWLVPIGWLLALYLPAQEQLDTRQRQQMQYIEALEWALNQRQGYDFGEEPLSGERLSLLQGLLPRLSSAGFTGVIRIEGHVGEFCLTTAQMNDGSQITILPEPDRPLTACQRIGYAPARAARESVAQSEAFSDYLQREQLLSDTAPIRVEIQAMGASRPALSYPDELDGVTTGDWNAIALGNNRVRFNLVAD